MKKSHLLNESIRTNRFNFIHNSVEKLNINRNFLAFFLVCFFLFQICREFLNLEEGCVSLGCLRRSCVHHILLRGSIHVVCVCVYVCVYLSFLQSTGTNKNEELMASHSLIQIPVVCQRTSGVIISWCLILHLFSLSLPVVSMTYGVLSLKAADLFGMILTIGKYLGMGKHSGFGPYSMFFFLFYFYEIDKKNKKAPSSIMKWSKYTEIQTGGHAAQCECGWQDDTMKSS